MGRSRRLVGVVVVLAGLAGCTADGGADRADAEPRVTSGVDDRSTLASGPPTATPSDGTTAPPVTTAPAVPTEPPASTETEVSSEPTVTAAPATEPAPEPFPEFEVAPVDWSSVRAGVEEAFVEVPLDHREPTGPTIELYVVRHLARDAGRRIGSLVVNPGGPGFGGSSLALNAGSIYGPDLVDRFDIVGWDPRGTGRSRPAVDCIDDLDAVLAIDTGPDDDAELEMLLAAARTLADGCVERSGSLLAHVTTAASARDIDLLRRALGETQLSYFGWSYGSLLGATWATLFPDTVRAAVLDGAMDPTAGRVGGLLAQAAGFERSLQAFLDDCSSRRSCAFRGDGDASRAFDDLLAAIETTPVPTGAGRPDLAQGTLELGVTWALYDDARWSRLGVALAEAATGDGAALARLADSYADRRSDGSYSNGLEAYFVVSCVDDPDTDGPTAALERREEALAVSPRLGTTIGFELLVCASLPKVDATAVTITGAGAGPILVVGNTGDPATPLDGSRRMAETLHDARLVVVEADSHTGYRLNDCIDTTVERYLVELELPPVGRTC